MSAHPWHDEMNRLLAKIEREAESSIYQLKETLNRSGLKFDGKFRKYFLRATDNRISETFDRFEIEMQEDAQYSYQHNAASRQVIFEERPHSSHSYSQHHEHVHQNPRYTDEYEYEHDDRSQSREPSYNNYCDRSMDRSMDQRPCSIKDRLGPKRKRSSSSEESIQLAKYSTDLMTKKCQQTERMNINEGQDEFTDNFSATEEEVDFGSLDAIRSKCIAIPTKSVTSNDVIFYCVYCQDLGYSPNSQSRCIEDVYAHWLSGHTDLPNVKPFAFSVTDQNCACFYCEKVDTYQQVLKHQKQLHRNRSTVIVTPWDRTKCAFCKYSGGNWIDHFESTHKMLLQIDAFNPISMTDDILNVLLSIDIHQKRQCGICNDTFETVHQLEYHTSYQHPDEHCTSIAFHDSHEMYLICDICNEKIDFQLYLNHLEEHSYDFDCPKCDFRCGDLIDLTFHDRQYHHVIVNALNFHCLQFAERLKRHFFNTKAVFGNGLILTKHNLLNTRFDDYTEFRYMVETIIDIKVKKFTWLVQKQCTHDETKEHTDSKECEQSEEESYPRSEVDYDDADDVDDLKEWEDYLDEPEEDSDASVVSESEFASMATSHSPPSSKPPSKLSTKAHKMKLKQQHYLIRNVCIHGIPRRQHENLSDIVLRVCWKLGLRISSRDIAAVYRVSKSDPMIIVKFTTHSAKQNIMYARQWTTLLTSDIIEIPAGVAASKIHIFNHLTKFFENLRKIANLAIHEQRIYSHCLTKHGFLVRRTKFSAERYVSSVGELQDYIGIYRYSSVSRSSDSDAGHF